METVQVWVILWTAWLRRALSLFVYLLVAQTATAENAALQLINQARQANRLPILTENSQLTAAAVNHATYMALHNTSAHDEQSSLPGFTGRSCLERVAHTGYPAGICLENNSVGQSSWQESGQELMSAIYHRMGFLGFEYDEIGFARHSEGSDRKQKKNFYSYVLGSSVRRELCSGRSASYGYRGGCSDRHFVVNKRLFDRRSNELANKAGDLVIYPWPDQRGVMPQFLNQEIPDPLPGIPLTGQPISVQFNPVKFKGSTITVTHLQLIDANGHELALLPEKNQHSDSHFGFGEFAWFPEQSLLWGSQYQAKLDYVINGYPGTKEWTFQTAAPPYTWRDKRLGVITIERSKQKIRLKHQGGYSLVLSPGLNSGRLAKVSALTRGKLDIHHEVSDVLSVRLAGESTLSLEFDGGRRVTVYLSNK